MPKLDISRIVRLIIVAASVAFISSLAVVLWQASRKQHLTLAAGAAGGDSYILGNALKTVVERHYPRIRITLLRPAGQSRTCRCSKTAAPSWPPHRPM